MAALGGGIDFETRTIYIIGPITHETSCRVIPAFRALDATKGSVRIVMDSGGGSEPEGFALYDVIRLANNPVHIDCYGMVQSIAALILQAGSERRMSSECRFMVHNGTMEMPGPVHQGTVISAARESSFTTERYQRILAERTGLLTFNDVEGFCKDETYLSAQEALEFGFIDGIIDAPNKTKTRQQKKSKTKVVVQSLIPTKKRKK